MNVDNTKECNKCGSLLQKVLGCDFVKCLQCGTEHASYTRLTDGKIYV